MTTIKNSHTAANTTKLMLHIISETPFHNKREHASTMNLSIFRTVSINLLLLLSEAIKHGLQFGLLTVRHSLRCHFHVDHSTFRSDISGNFLDSIVECFDAQLLVEGHACHDVHRRGNEFDDHRCFRNATVRSLCKTPM